MCVFTREVYIHTCHMHMRCPVPGRVNLYLALEKAGEDGGGIMPMTLRASSNSVRKEWAATVVKMMHGVGGGWRVQSQEESGGCHTAVVCNREEEMRAVFAQQGKTFVLQQFVPPLHLRRAGQISGPGVHIRAAVLVVGNLEVFLQVCPKMYADDGVVGESMEAVARRLDGLSGDTDVMELVRGWQSGMRAAVGRVFDVLRSRSLSLPPSLPPSLYVHACMHAYIHAFLHTYIHTCIHAYIHIYTCTYVHM